MSTILADHRGVVGNTGIDHIRSRLAEEGVDHVHYMAPMGTAALIAALGILSFELREALEDDANWRQLMKLLGSESIANQLVQRRRDRKIVDGRSLHQYVPLYFGTHTPMQYVVTRSDPARQGDVIVFVEVNVGKILAMDDIWYTDGNSACDETAFYDNSDGVDAIHWDIVLGKEPCLSRDSKRWKAAEMLVPQRVPPECIDRFVLIDTQTAQRFRLMTEQMATAGVLPFARFDVIDDNSHFCRMTGQGLAAYD